MFRIITVTFAISLVIAGVLAWSQEPSNPSVGATPPAGSAQAPATPSPEGTPAQSPTTPPTGSAQAPATGSPQGNPAQTPTQQAAPEQPQGTPAPAEGATQAKPQEKVEKALQATEQEKEKTVTKQAEQAVVTSAIRGRLELEINQSYVHSDSNQLFIDGFGVLPILIIGNASVERIRRDSFVSTFNTRYQVNPDLTAQLSIPYIETFLRVSTAVGLTGRTTVSPNAEQTSSGGGLGDISGSLSYHLLNESLYQPNMYFGLGFKARTGRDVFETTDSIKNPPTGSGFNSVTFTLNAVKSSDPAIVYGSVSYSYSIARHNVVFNRPNGPPLLVDFYPGDNFSYGFGIAYALNYKITISVGYSQSFNLISRITNIGAPHNQLPNSATDAASLRFGVVWRVSDKTSIDLSVSPGLTLDTPDVTVALRIPYRF